MKHSRVAVLLSILVLLSWLAVRAEAQCLPDPELSEVPDCITITPDGSFEYRVTVMGSDLGVPCGPLPGLLVEIEFLPVANSMIAWRVGQPNPVVAAVTDLNGDARFYLEGGGCVLDTQVAGCVNQAVARVSAGVVLADVLCVNSPDAVDGSGTLPACAPTTTCSGGITTVGLSDAVYHTNSIAGGLPDRCSKFVESFDAPVGLADAVIVTAYVLLGSTCPC